MCPGRAGAQGAELPVPQAAQAHVEPSYAGLETSDHELAQPEEDPERLAWRALDPRSEGVGLITAEGHVGLLDPSVVNGGERTGGPGWGLSMVTRRRRWPVLVGLGIGILYLEGSSQAGPYVGSTSSGASHGDTSVQRSDELRHAELLLRVEPWWGPVHLFVEGQFGLAGLWSSSSLQSSYAGLIHAHERQRSVSWIGGASAGLDVKLFRVHEDFTSFWDLRLALGVKRLYTGPMAGTRLEHAEGSTRLEPARAPLRIWQPFLALVLSIETKPRPAGY